MLKVMSITDFFCVFVPFFHFSCNLDAIAKLVLSERKSLNSTIYLILILTAFYGPNAELLGNIRLAIWQFQRPIEDITTYVSNVSLLLIVDLISFAVNGVMIWQYCQINVLKIMATIQKEFWLVFAIAEAFLQMEVSFE